MQICRAIGITRDSAVSVRISELEAGSLLPTSNSRNWPRRIRSYVALHPCALSCEPQLNPRNSTNLSALAWAQVRHCQRRWR